MKTLLNLLCAAQMAATVFGADALTFSTSKSSYLPGESIVANFSNAPGNLHDWVGLFSLGALDQNHIMWVYTDGTQTGNIGLKDGSVSFSSGITAEGNYEARFYLDDGYTKLAAVSFAVSTTGATSPPPSTFPPLPTNSIPAIPIQPSGRIQLSWEYPTNYLGPFAVTNYDPRAGTAIQTIVPDGTKFSIYGSLDLSNWVALTTVTNTTTAAVQILPVGARFLTITASNFWGESFFAPLLWLPPLPAPGTNLTAKRVE